jgi:hypothetical protein
MVLDIVASAVKFAFGVSAGFALVTFGVLFGVVWVTTGNVQAVTRGTGLVVVGVGLAMWGESSRRSAIGR